jgi:Type IV secretion-system coupling protein DNA-binding domain
MAAYHHAARSTPAGSAAAACCQSPSWPPSPSCPATRPCPAWPGPGHGRCRRRPASRCPARTPARSASPTPAPRPVALAVADGRHHLRIIGATGAGKSTLLTGQVLADAAAGRGAVLIDPKGDGVADILARLPEDAAGRVVLFDPDDRGAPPCLNVLQGDGTGADTDVITDNLTGIFCRIYAAFWGPRTDDLFRSICLTLLGSVPPGSGQVTLADIPALLTDEARRPGGVPPARSAAATSPSKGAGRAQVRRSELIPAWW